jgi:hypothetical protein
VARSAGEILQHFGFGTTPGGIRFAIALPS